MKGKPELHTRSNPQLHYMLRLCQAETDASTAVHWIKKLDDLHRSHPTEREAMEQREFESFCDLAVIASFVHSLSALLSLPPIHPKKGRIYVSRWKDSAKELDPLKTPIDLAKFAVPIDNLTEPGMAGEALNALDQFIIDQTGTNIGYLYQDLNEKCMSDIDNYCQQRKVQVEQDAKIEHDPPQQALLTKTSTTEVGIQQRREKDKTRPAHSSIYDISPPTKTPQPEIVEMTQVFRVKQATVDTFLSMLSNLKPRGSISWVAFEAAMADLRFSIIPKSGSVFTFLSPQDMGIQKSLTLHRPHKSHIEGHMLLLFASRLRRVYGWEEQSFEGA
jgi:hypothetical protein